MDSKSFLPLFLLISSWVSTGFCRSLLDLAGESLTDGSMSCIQKLLPCQPYLHPPPSLSSPPPATCCTPLKEMLSADSNCLCQVFNNVVLLKKFNLTQDDALKLPKACGAAADISLCEKDGVTPSNSPTTPADANPTNTKSTSGNSGSRESGAGRVGANGPVYAIHHHVIMGTMLAILF
ncbi:non-specific lipid transfer protein GPI-anchored 3 [Diospyros lotus]|uniref:non-specific lipid transfer protein GPI-anchored 3 n=1 Tax=Diospyros lotus TaxID=55363 RepID=UPI0022510901|nr:non-specific lipid transfer protein GPI-anchored 3 [Diospyros lotus]